MSDRTRQAPVAIVGAGLAGLVAARELHRHGVPVVVFEAGKQVAGLARSFRDDEGFTYDFGAHFITNRLAAALGVGAHCRVVDRYGEAVVLGGRSYNFPFGLLTDPRFVSSAVKGLMVRGRTPPDSARGRFTALYGERLANDVAIPLMNRAGVLRRNDGANAAKVDITESAFLHLIADDELALPFVRETTELTVASVPAIAGLYALRADAVGGTRRCITGGCGHGGLLHAGVWILSCTPRTRESSLGRRGGRFGSRIGRFIPVMPNQ